VKIHTGGEPGKWVVRVRSGETGLKKERFRSLLMKSVRPECGRRGDTAKDGRGEIPDSRTDDRAVFLGIPCSRADQGRGEKTSPILHSLRTVIGRAKQLTEICGRSEAAVFSSKTIEMTINGLGRVVLNARYAGGQVVLALRAPPAARDILERNHRDIEAALNHNASQPVTLITSVRRGRRNGRR